MKLVAETQCCFVGSTIDDAHTMAQSHAMYRHGIGFEPGSIISPSNSHYDAVVPMMGVPTGGINRKMLCQVCGALSSGLHFGVFTCEGCKCFYRRSIKEGANYACAKDRNCEITMETRNSCRYCRFQKCLALGMSKEGIKLGRRPKVDSDVFQHGFYPPGDMDYHAHGYWASMEHTPNFKTEPMFAESDEARDHLVYGDVASINYAMKPELYQTCGQLNGTHYGQNGYGSQCPEGQPNDHQIHFNRDPNWKSERHLSIYHHPHMPSEMYSVQNTEQLQSVHSPRAQLQSWTSELSPTTSASGSEDNWDGNAIMPNRVPLSVSLTLPEVQSGAVAAMAYANLYRGTNEASVKSAKCKDASGIQNGHFVMHKSNSRSYVELVPIREKSTSDYSDVHQTTNQSVSLYQESPPKTLQSLSRTDAESASLHHIKSTAGDSSLHTPWSETAGSPHKRKSLQQLDDVIVQSKKSSASLCSDNNNLCKKSDCVRLIQELTDHFLPLERVVAYQWKAYQESYGKQAHNDSPRYKDSAHLAAFLKTHGEEVLHQVRNFAANLPGFEELTQTQKDSLLHSTAPSIITTCLLQRDSWSSDGGKPVKGTVVTIDEGACFCAVMLLMAGKKNKSLNNDLCRKLSETLEDYISEKLTKRDPEKLQWLFQQLY